MLMTSSSAGALCHNSTVSLMSHTRKRAKRLIGYGRISTEAQDLTRQRQALKAYGCKVIFEDRASGKNFRVRGERIVVDQRLDVLGSIPACAGEPLGAAD